MDSNISDHRPTITTLQNIRTKAPKKIFKSINWNKFNQIITSQNNQTQFEKPKNPEDIDIEATAIPNTILSAIEISTSTYSITQSDKNKNKCRIPRHLVDLIREKRKIRRSFQKSQSAEIKTHLNALNRKCKIEISKFKLDKLKHEFQELNNFNQSQNKHWNLLKKLENGNQPTYEQIKIKVGDTITSDPKNIAKLFADNLDLVFKNNDFPLQPNPSQANDLPFNKISPKELVENIKKVKTKHPLESTESPT